MDKPTTQHFLKTNHSQTRPVKLLTYNIFMRPPGINTNGDDYKNERLEMIIEQLEKFDIVCFQELFGFLNLRKMRMQHKAFKRGFIYQATSPSPSFFSGAAVDGGLVTLSRFPITHQRFMPFPYGVLSDNLAHKGVLYTKIEIKGSNLHLFNTHFQASYVGKDENVRATVLTRIDQMIFYQQILSQILLEVSTNDLVLLVGDFNVDAKHLGYPTRYLDVYPEIKKQLNIDPLADLYSEYDVLMKYLSLWSKYPLIDLSKKKYQESQTTYGDSIEVNGQQVPVETVLTSPLDYHSHQSLDYILHLEIGKSELNVDIQSLTTEKFFVENQIFTQLSDHYGISCEII